MTPIFDCSSWASEGGTPAPLLRGRICVTPYKPEAHRLPPSRLKHDSRALFRAVPECFNIAEWRRLHLEPERVRHCDLEKLRNSYPDMIERGAAEAASRQLQPRAAQSRRRQADPPPSTIAILNKPHPRRRLA